MFDTLDSGLYWLHVTGPDGPDVLLGHFDSRMHLLTLHDDGDAIYAVEDPWVHKWRVHHVEAVVRPAFVPDPAI